MDEAQSWDQTQCDDSPWRFEPFPHSQIWRIDGTMSIEKVKIIYKCDACSKTGIAEVDDIGEEKLPTGWKTIHKPGDIRYLETNCHHCGDCRKKD